MLSFGIFIVFAAVCDSFAEEVCYPPCGCFNDDPPFATRPLPESYNDQEIIWLLYTQGSAQPDEIVIKSDGSIDIPPAFDPNKETKVLIHGWYGDRLSLRDIRDAYMEVADHNVLVVDWSTGAEKPYYPAAASNTQVVGACTAFVALELSDNLATFHCNGHSLGGQTCGYFGAATEGRLGRITGLDPAGPSFELFNETVRLDSSDADFVDVLHTNAPEGVAGAAGVRIPCGHVDFYPNKAGRQPGCEDDDCDHHICLNYMASSIRDPDCFPSYPCDSDDDADAGECDSCSIGNCQLMGEPAESQPGRGTYYLTTSATEPHCSNF